MNKTIKLLVAFIFVFSTVYYANGDLRNNLPAAVQGQLMPASTIEGKQAILNNVDVKKSASMDECATTEHDGEIKNLRPDEVRVYRAFLKLVKNTLGTTIDETTKILSESKTDKWEVYKIPPYLEAYVDRALLTLLELIIETAVNENYLNVSAVVAHAGGRKRNNTLIFPPPPPPPLDAFMEKPDFSVVGNFVRYDNRRRRQQEMKEEKKQKQKIAKAKKLVAKLEAANKRTVSAAAENVDRHHDEEVQSLSFMDQFWNNLEYFIYGNTTESSAPGQDDNKHPTKPTPLNSFLLYWAKLSVLVLLCCTTLNLMHQNQQMR